MALDRDVCLRDQRAFVGFAQRALALGIAAAVADDLGAGKAATACGACATISG